MHLPTLKKAIFQLEPGDEAGFAAIFGEVLKYQREHNQVYSRYCNSLSDVQTPFLPVEAFKYGAVTTFPPEEAVRVFESSGTGSMVRAKHYIKDPGLYEASILGHFDRVCSADEITLMAHLPHYSDNSRSSSLVYMVDYLMKTRGNAKSAFFLDDVDRLQHAIDAHAAGRGRFILFGAAFGLLNLLEQSAFSLPEDAIVIETGGMKTYRKEVTRDILHQQLADGFGVPMNQIWSEYGMCELLSQCYTKGGAVFYPPPWMRFYIVDPENPFEVLPEGKAGALALIDLANLYTVSALLTQDKAIQQGKGFELLGRLSGAELRGCNFLIEDLQHP